MKYPLLPLILWLIAGVHHAESATLTFDAAAPTDNVFLQNLTAGSGGTAISYTRTGSNRWAGFSFQPTASVQMSKVTLSVLSLSNTLENKQISVRVVELASLASAPALSETANVLATEAGEIPAGGLPASASAYLTFEFATPVALKADVAYGILVNFVPGPDNHTSGLSLRRAAAADQGGAIFFTENAGDTWSATENASCTFALTGAQP